MGKTLEVRVASVVDLETLVSLATAFRDHIGLSAPLEADWRTSIVRLLQDRDTEFLVAWSACGGTSLGYVQSRSATQRGRWRWRQRVKTSLWCRVRGGVGWGGSSWRMP